MSTLTEKQIKNLIDDMAYFDHKWGPQIWMMSRSVGGWYLLKRQDGSWWAVPEPDSVLLISDEGVEDTAIKSIVPSQVSAHQEMILKKEAREQGR